MTVTRTVVVATGNLGRNVTINEFERNLDRMIARVPGKNRFFQFQEIDEADTPEEMRMIRAKLGDTHRFAGVKTHVPIAVPKTFKVSSRLNRVASEGVAGLSPTRHVVQAVVWPDGHPDCKVIANNTHLARSAPRLYQARIDHDQVLREALAVPTASWLTGDLNSTDYPQLSRNEQEWVEARLDYIRGYERAGVKFELLQTGSINLTIDGHNAHWAKVQITWR